MLVVLVTQDHSQLGSKRSQGFYIGGKHQRSVELIENVAVNEEFSPEM